MSEKDPKEKRLGLTEIDKKTDEKSTVIETRGLISITDLSSFMVSKPLYMPMGVDSSSVITVSSSGSDLMSPSIMEQDRKVNDLKEKLKNTIKEKELTEEELGKRNEIIKQLHKAQSLKFLLDSVTSKAHEVILHESSDLTKDFLESPTCKSFVMSIDIRRSTELMLKANSPQEFANFISGLCLDLSVIVKDNYGVYDKFTGDGILAFFPEFFSGKDAGYYVLKAASQCHKAFESHYNKSRGSFNSVLKDVGLGIGIDFGETHLVQVLGGLTVVGAPVVYACRMGSAPAGITLLNHPAYIEIAQKYGSFIQVEETELEIKHEGKTLAYKIDQSAIKYDPDMPEWLLNKSTKEKTQKK